MTTRLIVAAIGLFIWQGCTPKPKQMRDPVQREQEEKAVAKQRKARRQQIAPETCKPFKKADLEAPTFVKTDNGGFVVTRVVKSCITRDGVRGYENGSPWMAMGVPCTGGPGAINIRGRSYAPKMISLSMSTDCKMNPEQAGVVERITAERLGLGPDTKLLAYNPFSVQYWEVEGYRDAGVGDAVELRTTDSISTAWIEFKDKNKPLVVQLYGRENAWVQDAKIFQVKAELSFVRPLNFKAKVLEVKVLNEAELKAANQRCEALGLRRRCAEVFN